MTTLLSRGNRRSRGFSGFVTFQGFAGRKIFLPSVGRQTRRQQRARRRDEAGRRRLGRGGKLGASEAVIAVEFAVELDQPIHRLEIALHHHSMRNDIASPTRAI